MSNTIETDPGFIHGGGSESVKPEGGDGRIGRRHAFTGLAALAIVPLASCTGGRTIPADSDEAFQDIEALIASTEAVVSLVESLGVVGPETIQGARDLIAKARSYVADAREAISSGGWKPLIDAAWKLLSGIVFAGVFVPAAPGETPAPAITMTLRK